MDKINAEIIYVLVNERKRRKGREKLKLGEIMETLNKLRILEKEVKVDPGDIQLLLRDLKDRGWVTVKGKFWKIHLKEAWPYVIKDVETARVLDSIVKFVSKTSKIDFETSEIIDYHIELYPKLKETVGEQFIEKEILTQLKKEPYSYIKIDPVKGKYRLVKESYYPEFSEGEKYYIDLILKYEFGEI